jgi:hypothetical protein
MRDSIINAIRNGQTIKDALAGYNYDDDLTNDAIRAAFAQIDGDINPDIAREAYEKGYAHLGKSYRHFDLMQKYKEAGFSAASIDY